MFSFPIGLHWISNQQTMKLAILVIAHFFFNLAFFNPAYGIKCNNVVHDTSIKTLDDLFWEFSNGLVPDLDVPLQIDVFRIYINMQWSNPYKLSWIHPYNPYGSPHIEDSLKKVVDVLKKYPHLSKEPFRHFHIKVQEKNYPITRRLSEFLNPQIRNAGRVKSNLFNIGENPTYWKGLLGYERSKEYNVKSKKTKELRKEEKEHFKLFFNERFPTELREKLDNKNISHYQKAKELYRYLKKEGQYLQQRGKNVRFISQAIVDLVHTVGFYNPILVQELKSSNGRDRLLAYKEILKERDRLTIELGYSNFNQMLESFSISFPTGMPDIKKWPQKLESLESDILYNTQPTEKTKLKTIRHLSIIESPFRSCLGNDCSSSEDLLKALDPNYHYFTLTGKAGFSRGHVTIVLGEAITNSKAIKVAFIDKIQNIKTQYLFEMLEGLRRSVEENGYQLALDEKIDADNKISNSNEIRHFLKKNIDKITSKEILTNFKPHSHSYDFPSVLSRAKNKLPLRPVTFPIETSKKFEINPSGFTQPKISNFNFKELIESLNRLKEGNLENKIRYVSSMVILKELGYEIDPEFESTFLNLWLANPKMPFKFRKKIFLNGWTVSEKFLPNSFEYFSLEEQVTLIQNIYDSPTYINNIFRKLAPLLVVKVRKNKNLRESIPLCSPYHKTIISKVLDASDISDETAIEIIKIIEIGPSALYVDIPPHRFIKIIKYLKGSSSKEEIESAITEELIRWIYLVNNSSPSLFIKGLLSSNNLEALEFLDTLVETVIKLKNGNLQDKMLYLVCMRKINKEVGARGDLNFESTLTSWLESASTPFELKTRIDILFPEIPAYSLSIP